MHGEIHFFPNNGGFTDEDGEDLIGYYFRFVDDETGSTTHLIGPYNTGPEAERACQKEWRSQ